MNNFIRSGRPIAAQLLSSSSHHPSPKRLISLYPNSNSFLQQQYSLCSTASWKKKNNQQQKPNPRKPKIIQDHPVEEPSPPSSSAAAQEEIQKKPPASSSVDWPRPSEIPWQAKVANSVNLVGRIQSPLQFHSSPDDGKYWAAALFAQDSISLRIPLIFEGDLAHIATCHLKEKDCVYIHGQLSKDPPPFTLNCGPSTFQVMVHNINFIEASTQPKNGFSSYITLLHLENVKDNSCQKKESKDDDSQRKESVTDTSFQKSESVKDDTYQRKESVREDNSADQSLIDLMTKPHEWWDIRLNQGNSTSAAFEHKVDGKLLCINESTPDWIMMKLDCLTFDQKVEKKSLKASTTKNGDLILNSWRDLLTNPKQWRDNRENKLKGVVKPKYPDFKNKDSGIGLWLDSAPKWVLPGLEGLEFDVPFKKMKEDDNDSWQDLVENPEKWWDNRSNKMNKKSPDFKHKDSGKGLWLSDTPAWASSKLPPLKASPN